MLRTAQPESQQAAAECYQPVDVWVCRHFTSRVSWRGKKTRWDATPIGTRTFGAAISRVVDLALSGQADLDYVINLGTVPGVLMAVSSLP